MQRITKHALCLTAALAGVELVALLLALGARPVVQAAGTPPGDLDGVTRLQCVAMDLSAYGWGPPVVPA